MYTTITVNGLGGSRFLSFLGEKFPGDLPPILALLVKGHEQAGEQIGERLASIEVETDVAEEVADFVERLIADGAVTNETEPPLLFSPNVGDGIAIVRDVLVEFLIAGKRAPRIWRYVARGTRGRVIAHQGDTDRVLIEPSREIAYVRPASMTGMRFWSGAPR